MAPSISGRKPSVHALDGHTSLDRNFSFIGMLGLAFAILNSWTALAASISLALPSGGPTSVLWGLITAGVCNLALAASMAEFLSALPTAAGQAYWVYSVAPRGKNVLAYMTGYINVAGWIALTATGGLLGSQLIIGLISLWSPSYVGQRWQQFLIYIGYTVFAFLMNTFATPALPLFNKLALGWSLTGFTVISITILATASPNYASAEYVFGEFYNSTGWPDGVAWLLGLLQGGLGLTGYDAVAHMIEEIPDPTRLGPRVMLACVCIGAFTGFVFLMVLLFVSGGQSQLSTLITTANTPLVEIFYTSTNSKVGATCLLMFPLVCLLFATTAIMTTSSRMTWSFARSRGLPFSPFFARTHLSLRLPLNSLALTTALVIIFGCIFLGSTAAFNAIVSASVVALGLSYAIPVFVNLLILRRGLPDPVSSPEALAAGHRLFRIRPEPLAWACNVLGVVYVAVTSVLFLFPATLPTTASGMNYCVAALGIVLVVAGVQWVVDGRKSFDGEALREAAAEAERGFGADEMVGVEVGGNGGQVGTGKGMGVEMGEKRE